MKEIYDKNIEQIEKRKDYSEVLKRIKSDVKETEDIKVCTEIVEEKKVLYVIKDGKTFLLDSLYSSKRFEDSWLEGAQIKWDSKFFILGLGNGMLVRKILSMVDKESFIFVFEPSVAIFKEAINQFDISDILADKRLLLFFSDENTGDINVHNTVCTMISYRDIFNARILKYPNYNILFPEAVEKFQVEIDQVAKTISVNSNTYGTFGVNFISNSIRNATLMTTAKKFSETYQKMPEGVTGILVSCGPSLEKNVDFLKRAKGKSLIIAGDSSVKAMVAHGIYPDIYVTVDMKKPMEIFDVEGMYDIPVVCTLDCTYDALKNQKAPIYMFATDDNYISHYMVEKQIEFFALGTGGCEATTAMSFLMALGINNIILVGQDLAYTGGTVYASTSAGATWDQQKLIDEDNCITEGIDGEPILTSMQFNSYRHWFERQVKVYEDLTLINATEGGARIHGALEMTLNEAIDKYCTKDFDIGEVISSTGMLFTDAQREDFASYMRAIPDEISELRGVINAGLKIYDKLSSVVYSSKLDTSKLKKLLADYEKNIVKLNSYTVFYYVECMVMKEMNELHRESVTGSMSDLDELKDTISNGKKRYELLLRGVDLFMDMWDEIRDERF